LPQTEQRQADENEAFHKDGRQSELVRDRAESMESNNSIGKVGIEAHSRGERNGHVGAEAHHEGGQGGDGSGPGDEVTVDDAEAKVIVEVVAAGWVGRAGGADAGAAAVGENGGIDL
jgi:hypothetical protein